MTKVRIQLRLYTLLPEFLSNLEVEWLQAKRLELLARPSWLTAPVVKPLKITFTSFEEGRMVGRRRKLDNITAEYHGKRARTIAQQDDRGVSHRLPRHSKSLYAEDLASDAVSVRIGTSIHGSQWTALQASSTSEHVHYTDSTSERLDANCVPTTYSVNKVLEDNVDASSSVFEPLESCGKSSSSIFEPLESDPGNFQYHVPVSQRKNRVEDNKSPALTPSHTRQRNGRLIFPSSPLRPQASNSVAFTISASRIPTTDRSISAQASNEESIESNSNEEEWRGFVDIGFISDDMIAKGNYSSDIPESTNNGFASDPTESGEWPGITGEQSSSPSMLYSGFSCSDDAQRDGSAPAPGNNDGNDSSNLIVIALPGILKMGLGYSPTRTFNESSPPQASLKLVSCMKPTEPFVATGQDTLNQEPTHSQITQKDAEEDPDNVWYRFVFGNDKKVEENSESEEQERLQLKSPVESLVVEASEPLSAKWSSTPTKSSLKAVISSSPDPLALQDSDLSEEGNQVHQPKVIFRKPIRFDGTKPRADTVHIGRNLRSSSSPDLHPGIEWRKSRAARPRQPEMTWLPSGFEDDEEIEDEDDC